MKLYLQFALGLFCFAITPVMAQYNLYYKINLRPDISSSPDRGCKRSVEFNLQETRTDGSEYRYIDYYSEHSCSGLFCGSCDENKTADRNDFSVDSGMITRPIPLKAMRGYFKTRNGGFWNTGYFETTRNETFDGSIAHVIFDKSVYFYGSSVLFDAEFLYVPTFLSYPILLTSNTNGVISGTSATFKAPDFMINNFPPNLLSWQISDVNGAIYNAKGYQITYDMSNSSKCKQLRVEVTVNGGYGWKSSSKFFEFRPLPNLTIGSTLLITQPLCTETQKNGQDGKTFGYVTLGNDALAKKYLLTLFDKDNAQNLVHLDKDIPSTELKIEYSPYRFEVEEDFGNDISSCIQTFNDIQINNPKPIEVINQNFTDIQCFGQKPKLSITIDGNTNNYTLSYGDSSKVLSQNQIYSIPLMTQSRAYSFNITDENACIYDQALNFTATEPSKLEATMQIDSAVCYRGTTTVRINAKGGTPYSSENPYRYGFAPSSSVQLDPILITKGGVTIYPRVYDKNNCSVSFPVTTLFNPKDFKLSVLEKFDNICPKGKVGSVLLTSQSVDKSYRYTFSKDGIAYAKDSLFQSLGAGGYTFHAQNQYGCLKDTTLQITEPHYITISKVALDSVRCFGENNGSIQLNVTGGTGFKKLWKNKEPAYLPSNKSYSFSHTYDSLAGRSYWFHAQDSLGCLDSIAYSIGTRSHIQHRSNLISPSCNESKDGQITAYTEGGVAPYNNSWVNHPELNTALLQKGLAKGTYILLSTDKLGCQKSDTIVLQAPPSLLVDLQGYPLICKGQSVELDAGVDGDRYLWSGSNGFSASTRKVTIDKRGTYWVEVKDYNLCVGSDTISFEQSDTEFKVDFLMATTVVQGDTVVLLNDNVSIDSMRWNLNPNNTKKLPPSLDFRAQEAIFSDLGEQDVQLMGYYKGCRDVRTRKIWVIAPQDRNKYDQAIGIKTSVIKECGLFPNPNDGSFEIHIELNEANVPVAMVLSSLATGTSIKQLDWKIYPNNKIAFQEDLPEGAYIIHVKVRDEVVALRFLVAFD